MTNCGISHSIADAILNDVIDHRTGKTEAFRQLKCTCQTRQLSK